MFCTVVVLVVDCKRRGAPLVKYRGAVPNESTWEVSRLGGSGGKQRGMVRPCGVWRDMVGEVVVRAASVP